MIRCSGLKFVFEPFCGTGRGDIKVGVLVITIGIKGTKWGKGNREGRYVAQGDGTLRWEF